MRTLAASLSFSILVASASALAQEPPAEAEGDGDAQDPLEQFAWQLEGVAKLGSRAEVPIPEGLRFLKGEEASRLIEAMGNLSGRRELGLMATKDLSWFVVFYFDDVGYVKDDDKDKLDANEMAKQMTENLVDSNEARRDQGLEELNFDGWAIPPRYNTETKQLEWAHRLSSKGGISVNYNTRVLGRRGVMRLILVTDPELLEASLPPFRSLMEGFKFVVEENYASYRPGDKIAEYGLIALVAGGAGAVAAKTGLLAAAATFFKKGAKLIIAGFVALGAALKKLFTKKSE